VVFPVRRSQLRSHSLATSSGGWSPSMSAAHLLIAAAGGLPEAAAAPEHEASAPAPSMSAAHLLIAAAGGLPEAAGPEHDEPAHAPAGAAAPPPGSFPAAAAAPSNGADAGLAPERPELRTVPSAGDGGGSREGSGQQGLVEDWRGPSGQPSGQQADGEEDEDNSNGPGLRLADLLGSSGAPDRALCTALACPEQRCHVAAAQTRRCVCQTGLELLRKALTGQAERAALHATG
jgi:hypothetical protein